MKKERENALIRKARQGDTAAFGEIIRRYQNLVHATAFRILKDPTLAEDVSQEAFVAAFRSLQNLRAEGSFPSWLRKITRNLALAVHKEQGRFRTLEEAGTLHSPSVEAGAEAERQKRDADAFSEEVRRIVSTLSDTLRFPVLLCYVDDLPAASAARFLGITEGALRKRLHDGKRKLQERIVRMAEKSFRVYRLPPDFANRCICGCLRAQKAIKRKREKEVKGWPRR